MIIESPSRNTSSDRADEETAATTATAIAAATTQPSSSRSHRGAVLRRGVSSALTLTLSHGRVAASPPHLRMRAGMRTRPGLPSRNSAPNLS
ncbi:hypothetical protein GCM10025774_28150 [Microbacterium kyungheense]